VKIFLTGASGFIGNYFIQHYQEKYTIETFSFLQENFNDLDLLKSDVVIHLSALVHQMGGAAKEEYERVNVKQTLDLAKKAKKSGVKQFIFMSSVKVYGEESNSAYSEQTLCKPKDPYGESKLKAENELRKLEDENFRVAVIRTPIVYGYGVKANIKNLVSLVEKIPVLPFAKINNRRSMIYIGNLAYFIDIIIQKQASGIFLVSDKRALSTSELIELIALALEKRVYLIKIPLFESFLKRVKPSFHKRLFESLEIDNKETMYRLFADEKDPLSYSIEDGINLMINGEKQ